MWTASIQSSATIHSVSSIPPSVHPSPTPNHSSFHLLSTCSSPQPSSTLASIHCPSTYPTFHPSSTHPFIHLFLSSLPLLIFHPLYQSIGCSFIYPPTHPVFHYPSTHPSSLPFFIYSFIHLSNSSSTHPSIILLSIHPSFHFPSFHYPPTVYFPILSFSFHSLVIYF